MSFNDCGNRVLMEIEISSGVVIKIVLCLLKFILNTMRINVEIVLGV